MNKANKAGSCILEGAREALSYARGEADISKFGIHIPANSTAVDRTLKRFLLA